MLIFFLASFVSSTIFVARWCLLFGGVCFLYGVFFSTMFVFSANVFLAMFFFFPTMDVVCFLGHVYFLDDVCVPGDA
jgi:hypothetical protein